jgi:hypothetical protein
MRDILACAALLPVLLHGGCAGPGVGQSPADEGSGLPAPPVTRLTSASPDGDRVEWTSALLHSGNAVEHEDYIELAPAAEQFSWVIFEVPVDSDLPYGLSVHTLSGDSPQPVHVMLADYEHMRWTPLARTHDTTYEQNFDLPADGLQCVSPAGTINLAVVCASADGAEVSHLSIGWRSELALDLFDQVVASETNLHNTEGAYKDYVWHDHGPVIPVWAGFIFNIDDSQYATFLLEHGIGHTLTDVHPESYRLHVTWEIDAGRCAAITREADRSENLAGPLDMHFREFLIRRHLESVWRSQQYYVNLTGTYGTSADLVYWSLLDERYAGQHVGFGLQIEILAYHDRFYAIGGFDDTWLQVGLMGDMTPVARPDWADD